MAVAALPRLVTSLSVAAPTAPGQKLLGGGGGTATPGQKLVGGHRRRRVRSFSVAALTAPGQKLFGGGTDGAASEAFRWWH